MNQGLSRIRHVAHTAQLRQDALDCQQGHTKEVTLYATTNSALWKPESEAYVYNLVISGCCKPSATGEEWGPPNRPTSTVAVQQSDLYTVYVAILVFDITHTTNMLIQHLRIFMDISHMRQVPV